ncbi:MAG TPA: nitroreductase family protein [Dehalococcoidia bacterium]|nr:nitroreductase family protein [Dehalococcoidia bacterium]
MTIEQAIRDRRSIRALHGPALPAAEVDVLVALALTAPAPHHTQPWRFVAIEGANRERLASAMGDAWRVDLEGDGVPVARQDRLVARSRAQIVDAPTLLLGCIVGEGLRDYPDDFRRRSEWTMATHSFGAAMQNILLAVAERDLAAYWLSAPLYAPEAVRGALDLPEEWVPQAFIAVGRRDPAYQPASRPEPALERYLMRR